MKHEATIVMDNRKELGKRQDFELQRGDRDSWKPVSWARLKKAAQEETGSRRPKVSIVLRAAKGNEWLDDGQDFGLDSTSALRTGKKLIHDGLADSVWVEVRYYRPFSQRGPTAHTLLRLERRVQNPRQNAAARTKNPSVGNLVARALR